MFRKCKHYHTRCVHGDEINYLMKIYIIRFWKQGVVYRQVCTDCGKPLDRTAICTALGHDLHRWTGPWVEQRRGDRESIMGESS